MIRGSDYRDKHTVYAFNAACPIGQTVEVEGLGTCVIYAPARYCLFPHQNYVDVQMQRDMTVKEFQTYTSGWDHKRLEKRKMRIADVPVRLISA